MSDILSALKAEYYRRVAEGLCPTCGAADGAAHESEGALCNLPSAPDPIATLRAALAIAERERDAAIARAEAVAVASRDWQRSCRHARGCPVCDPLSDALDAYDAARAAVRAKGENVTPHLPQFETAIDRGKL